MVSFERFILKDGVPIYQQIILYIKEGIVSGTIVDGEELPSRRMLSALLGVNPNTVQKAFKLIEDEGLIQSHTGAKSFVRASQETAERLRRELLSLRMADAVAALKQLGVSREEALSLIESMWG